jgi:copper resistance protein B
MKMQFLKQSKAGLTAVLLAGATFGAAPAVLAQAGPHAAQMPGMDHSAMPAPNGTAPQSTPSKAVTESRTPIPALTEADRTAAFINSDGHTVHDKAINYFFLLDRLEWQNARDGNALNWDFNGWIGGDINRLWLRSEGERSNGKLEEAEVEALWGHAISPWWDVVGGVRHDFKPGKSQTWAAFGLQGLALYNFEAEATAYVGENGQTAARLKGEYDVLITNRLILQPSAEVNFYGQNDRTREIGSGLSGTEFGLRLRYEVRREIAPYVGVTWNRSYGNTADFKRADGRNPTETRLLAGVRMWF